MKRTWAVCRTLSIQKNLEDLGEVTGKRYREVGKWGDRELQIVAAGFSQRKVRTPSEMMLVNY
ncbi:hypothetical protein TPADAL_0494a [Treponema pallidum subsp. pallidum DAL-1]|uniref:Uncharacterized protein n=2 Tax=Treponema pallidum TaxID=160 RepID=A0AAU8RNK6_TREPL|nr:hypothetical protein TPESAMD_0494a [Treponema pallidum subsp. pertenue str. SamoaD]AEZ58686.1 hypothetical protein TPECDC2_0494a [Treponema pallidum subsp. pertenue str. CDC2]AEZ59754.1 hypothetical protein TPEGAU_0494a [Treponema pallidum subsp. pertenue str. Gauthier]AEZ60817.1 hypothetical protein TPADAL_0494a [Treponema pallidum subsp. pallidum DAL-1]AGK84139.1 hypothetical protein TPFB_0494a [Treponema pallidum str. Fribourg-Blanc]AJB40514.1 hypothetical protein TENDBA_0494a [Treponema